MPGTGRGGCCSGCSSVPSENKLVEGNCTRLRSGNPTRSPPAFAAVPTLCRVHIPSGARLLACCTARHVTYDDPDD